MPRKPDAKIKRHEDLEKYITLNPFVTDNELAKRYKVSINTIRLDRNILNIKELRERLKDIADNNYSEVKSLNSNEIIGDILEIEPGEKAVAIFNTKKYMTFEKNNIVRGHYLYSFAESLAIALIPEDMALVGIANIKYKVPVYAPDILIGHAIIVKRRLNNYIVHIVVKSYDNEVFRSKFILKAIETN